MVEHFEGGTENAEPIGCGESRQSAMEAATKINGGESDLRRVLDYDPSADLVRHDPMDRWNFSTRNGTTIPACLIPKPRAGDFRQRFILKTAKRD